MGERKPPYMQPQRVARFDMPRIGPVVTDSYVVIRTNKCPGLPVPPETGWWKWQRQVWVPADERTPLDEFARTVRGQALPNARDRGALAQPTPWVISSELERRVLVVDDRPVPVDATTWDRWVAYLNGAFGAGRWQAHQSDRNKPVTFWAGRSWVGVLLPVHDRMLPAPPPALEVPDPPVREETTSHG